MEGAEGRFNILITLHFFFKTHIVIQLIVDNFIVIV